MSTNPEKLPWWETKQTKLVAVVFAVIGTFVLAPYALESMRGPARIAQAKTEVASLVGAINLYFTNYARFPCPKSLLTNQPSDFTFGTFGTSASKIGITNSTGAQANNSTIMAALLDLTNFGNGNPTPNTNDALNPQKIVFLNARMSGDTNSPGIGIDGVYRDPWGNPYIISINLEGRTNCMDAFYRLASVSESGSGQAGLNGLFRRKPPPYTNQDARDSFVAPVSVMVWSLGPDAKADRLQKANQGVNKDNITSW